MLRDYQIDQINQVNLPGNPIINLPTGTGKGSIFAYLLDEHYQNGLNSLVITPSISLVHNINDRYKEIFDRAPTFKAATYQSLVRQGKQIFDRILIDECHITACNSLQTILKNASYEKLIGASATPSRLDNRSLLTYFTHTTNCHPLRWFIERKYLSDYKLLTVDSTIRAELADSYADRLELQQKLLNSKVEIANAVEQWREHAYGKKTFFFCSGKEHGKALCEQFTDSFPEFNFVYIDSDSTAQEVKDAIEGFKNGFYTGIFNIDLLILGIDIPSAECCHLLRFTYSVTRYLQCIGRVLRYFKGKIAVILDPLGNCLEHGHPDLKREWSLDGTAKRSKDAYCRCCMCQIPLIETAQAKKQKDDNDEFNIICFACHAFNVYQFHEPVRRIARTKKQVQIALSEYVPESENDHGMTRVINHPNMKRYHKKDRIIQSGLEIQEQYRLLLLIGYDPVTAKKILKII